MIANDLLATTIITVLLIVLVSACSVTDLLNRKIPNNLLMVSLAIAFLCHGLGGTPSALLYSVLGLFLGMAMLLPFYLLGGTSAGDVKLLGVVGALLGPYGVTVAGLATLLFGGLLGVAYILWRLVRPLAETRIPHGWHLSGFSLVPEDVSGDEHDKNSQTIPYAPAIAGGTFTAIWHLNLLGTVAG